MKTALTLAAVASLSLLAACGEKAAEPAATTEVAPADAMVNNEAYPAADGMAPAADATPAADAMAAGADAVAAGAADAADAVKAGADNAVDAAQDAAKK